MNEYTSDPYGLGPQYPPGAGVPSPEANRAQWAAHLGGETISQARAAGDVARQLGGGAPAPGVSDADLGAQAAAAGAQAGVTPNDGTLPHELQVEQEFARLRAQNEDMMARLAAMERERRLERQAHIAALGEPILERYAAGVRDKMRTHAVMHPALGHAHFGRALEASSALYEEAHRAIQSGGNDLAGVVQRAKEVERFVTRTHPRTVPGNAHHVDFSSVLYDLELMLEEAARLAPAIVAAF